MNDQVQSYLLGELKLLPDASLVEWKETARALTKSHREKLQGSLPRLLPILPEAEMGAVLEGLVESGEAGIAPILAALDSELIPKPLRKAARRALHLLSTKGVQVKPSAPPTPQRLPTTRWRAWFTAPDYYGDQFWILEKKSHRWDLFDALTSENWLEEFDYEDHVSPTACEAILQEIKEDMAQRRLNALVVEIDPNHARWRLLYAAERARKLGKKLPRAFPYVKKELAPPEGSERHPIWLFFNSFELRVDPELRDPDRAEEILHRQYQFYIVHPALAGEEYLSRYNRASGGRLALPPSVREQRLDELFHEIIAAHLSEAWLEDWRWRLQDYAYVWHRQGWSDVARLALYWSLQMESLDPKQNPFLHFFITTNLEMFTALQEQKARE